MTSILQPPYPIHPSVVDKIHPDYAAFYNQHIYDKQQVHLQPVAASRSSGILIPGGGPLLAVGKTQDFAITRTTSTGSEVRVRCFTPDGAIPEGGWPVFIYFHGGGWVLGNIDTENTVCTNICNRANCVVVSVDYRLAPENPYPAAVHDSWEAVLWVQTFGVSLLALNISKVATGGSSAGGNLAAVMCQKALTSSSPVKFIKQVLIVPVTDNTATVRNNATWAANEFVPALPAAKMIWYRKHYLPNEKDWANPEASPLLWEGDWRNLPEAEIVVGGLDVLREEGEKFGARLADAGVNVHLHVMGGMPHPFLAMDGALKAGREAISVMVNSLKTAFA